MDNETPNSREIQAAFAEYDRHETIGNFKVACVIGMVLMPAGFVLDSFVYPAQAIYFLKMRLLCSVLIGLFLAGLLTPIGRRYYRFQGVTLFMLPASFIAWMVWRTTGQLSPYYAGLNLVILVLAYVLHWTFRESLVAAGLVILLYLMACLIPRETHVADVGSLVNNLYFLVLTGMITVTGSYFHSKARFREFALRFELDRNLEQLKEAETQLVQSEKLASLGRMSAGIIHEINNPLNYATTGLFTLRNKGKHLAPEQQEEYRDVLQDVEEGIQRVKTIVSDLRTFTHPDTESRDQVEVPEVVAAALRFLSNEWKDKVRVEQKLDEHQTVWANKNKLIHVVVNLLQNSLDALKAPSATDRQPTIWVEGRLEAGKSLLVVRDNGPGIEPEHLDKIFDPFYTTKDVGEGMGLGLAICYRIVREYDGQISVQTEPGKFCEFKLEFPAKGQELMA